MTNEYMLSTIDNPFNPFTQWNDWKRFDEDMGYFTCSYLARIAKTSDDLSDADMDRAINAAIDEIVNLNILGVYRKVYNQTETLPGGES
jgi:hypothetical protein